MPPVAFPENDGMEGLSTSHDGRGWRVTGEVNDGSGVKPGATGTVRWKPDDYWTFYGAAESVTGSPSGSTPPTLKVSVLPSWME